jgi:hypothetical protein
MPRSSDLIEDVAFDDVIAGADVAFAYALLRCGTEGQLDKDPDNRLRLTIGLRKERGPGS